MRVPCPTDNVRRWDAGKRVIPIIFASVLTTNWPRLKKWLRVNDQAKMENIL